ncbi:MAG: GspE/PulE family protein [Phycisphaerae bacterium]|nr:GspE/PulE family protein [Phycisphaerae bacterium]
MGPVDNKKPSIKLPGDLSAAHSSGGSGNDYLWQPSPDQTARRGPEGLLLAKGVITAELLDEARAKQADDPRISVLEALVKNGAIDEMLALQTTAEYFKLPFRRITEQDVNPDVLDILPMDYLRAKSVLPLDKHQNSVVMAISNPEDIFLLDDFRRRLNMSVKLVVSPPADIQKAIAELSAGPSAQVDEILSDFDVDEGSVEVMDEEAEQVEDLEKMAGESPVIRYVNFLISSAVHEGASDIHIEPGKKRLRVRFRMDGILFDQSAPSVQMQAAILSRLKIMAKLDIAETRLPQDGRIRATVHGRNVDLRVSTLPTVHGEKCVIRILDNRSITVGLEQLGMAVDTLDEIQNQIHQPNGIILVTGPTGSGKSTTLYSALQILDSSKLNISTVEDPVEYELASINQVHVHESIGMTFSIALRSLLRQDPDVVMIGEIRDAETARIAVQASLTGHLVLSTLHTNDAPSCITRLINIGVEPYLISAALNAILAQRLVRKICPDCKIEVTEASQREMEHLTRCGVSGIKLYRGAGCEKCRQTGYKGRLGIYELLTVDDEMGDLISHCPSLMELRNYAKKIGMRNLRIDGFEKVAAGLTTVAEIMRVTQS